MQAPSTTEYAVLGLLARGERSGYELAVAARRGVGYVWTPTKSQVYAVLPRLVERGYATRRRVRQSARPDKHVYAITDAGRAALDDWLRTPVGEEPARSVFLLKLFLAGNAGPETAREHVARRRERAEDALAEYQEIERRIAGRPEDYYGYLTLRWGLKEARAIIEWADEVLAELNQRAKTVV